MHPVFRDLERWRGEVPAGFQVNFLGVMTRTSFFGETGPRPEFGEMEPRPESGQVEASLPPLNEEYFEWIDLLEAVRQARQRFTMLELGAGWGPWLVNAAAAVTRCNPLPLHLVGVEAEPTHYAWMQQHFRDNGIDPNAQSLFRAAVASEDGTAAFFVGQAADWYGQSLAPMGGRLRWLRAALRSILALRHRRPTSPRLGSGQGGDPRLTAEVAQVPTISLRTLLAPFDRVDLIDLDVQGAELEVLRAAAAEICHKVRRVHIGTHGRRIEAGLRRLFAELGWTPVNDYACHSDADTPWGRISFNDGVQTWCNPELKAPPC